MKLRSYQLEAVESTFQSWKENRSVVGRLFTGGGKTIIFADVIKRCQKRAIVICHRRELIWQAREKIERVTGFKFQVEMGEYKAVNNFEPDFFNPSNVGEAGVVASVDTLTRGGDGFGRMTKFLPNDFDYLIGDEFHHFTSPQFRRVMDYFKQNQNLKILGVTATPNRSDEESLSQIADGVAFDMDMSYGIENGWLVEMKAQSPYIESVNFVGINTVAGDLNQGQLAQRMEGQKALFGMADSIYGIIGNKSGIIFSPSVNHAKLMADILNSFKPGMAAHVNGKTDKDERRKINSDFDNGAIQVIVNCGTHTEGYDSARVEFVVPKPTKSISLLEQMCGRSTRPCDEIAGKLGNFSNAGLRRALIQRSSKPSCLIIEYYGNRYDLATTFNLFSGNVTEESVKTMIAAARKSGNQMPVKKSLEEEEKRLEEKNKKELAEITLNSKIKVQIKQSIRHFDPFSVLGIIAAKPRGWDVKKEASDKMRAVLRKNELNPDDFNYAQTKQLVGQIIARFDRSKNLCSFKQVKKLSEFGIKAVDFTFPQAQEAFSYLKTVSWRRKGNEGFKPKLKIKIPVRNDSYEPPQTNSLHEPIIDSKVPF